MRRSIDIVRKSARKRTPPTPSLIKEGAKGEFYRRWKVWPWVAAAAALLIIAALGFVLLPHAAITVRARSEPVTRDLEIRVSTEQAAADSARLVVPGRLVADEISGSKTVAATGARNIGQKASGFVYIYNFSKTTLILKKDTTTLTAAGRKYFFTQDAPGIRPTALLGLENQEVDPTSLTAPVPVVAEAPGEEYNLGASARLEIQNEAFGSNPKTLYAVTTDDGLRGGSTKEIKIIRDEDIKKGYESLAAELSAKAKEKFDGFLETEVTDPATTGVAGQEAAEFTVSGKLKVRGLAFSRDDVLAVARARASRLLPPQKELLAEENQRLQAVFREANLGDGRGTLAVHYEGEIVYRLDSEELLTKVRGRTPAEISEILLSRPEIADVQVELRPFWVKKAPKWGKNITIDTR